MLKKKEEQTTGKNIGKNMCKIEQKLQRKHLIALSFFLPLLVMAGCCIVFGVQPFGDNSLLIIDGLHQYMPFYSVLYDKLKGGETLFYSFRSGLGINFLSLFSRLCRSDGGKKYYSESQEIGSVSYRSYFILS